MEAGITIADRYLKRVVQAAVGPFAFCNHGFESDAVTARTQFDVTIGVAYTAGLTTIECQKNEGEFTS